MWLFSNAQMRRAAAKGHAAMVVMVAVHTNK